MSAMGTPTLLRVKRLRTADPSEMIVIKAKKRRAEEDEGEGRGDDFKILKLATTVDEKGDSSKLNEAVTKILAKKTAPRSYEELKERYKKSCISTTKLPGANDREAREARDEQRFRLVAQKRAIRLDDLEDWAEEEDEVEEKEGTPPVMEGRELYKLYDLVGEGEPAEADRGQVEGEKVMCNGVELVREFVGGKQGDVDSSYVYDVYYTDGIEDGRDGGDFDDSLLDGLFSIQPFNGGDCELMYEEYGEGRKACFGEDLDSNDEDNSGNEYPDEDSSDDDGSYGGYCDEDGLTSGVRGLGLGYSSGDEPNSESDAEDELVFTRSFDEDANRHGTAYARFKQNILKEFKECEDDEDEVD